MKPSLLSFLPILFVLLAGASGAARAESGAPGAEVLAKKLEGELIAPCCWSQTIGEHRSEASEQMRREIRDMIDKNMSHQQIIDFYVAQYGERILAAPRPRGFNLMAYVLPGAALLAGAWVVVVLMRRWRPCPTSKPPTPEMADPVYLARVERDLKGMR